MRAAYFWDTTAPRLWGDYWAGPNPHSADNGHGKVFKPSVGGRVCKALKLSVLPEEELEKGKGQHSEPCLSRGT